MSFSNKLITEKNGSRYGRMIHPWLRRKQDIMVDTPSRRDGMSYEEELFKRQQGGVFIFDIVLHLTLGKGEHGLSGVASTLFNRFFNVHSFKMCDFRDVAAACVFLAGKNEDSPKKLKYVVNHLWQLKYPHQKHFPSEQTFVDQCTVVTYLEEVVLRSISFDINVDLPHQYVLKLMRDVEKGRNVYKEMVKTAYYMATDVLIITDWSVRYTCASIATACVNIAAYFHNIKMDEIVPPELANHWFCFQDESMTRAEVEVMTTEFLDIFARNPAFHIGSLKKIDVNGKVKIVGRAKTPPPQATTSLSASGSSSSNLKKIDYEAYKGRQKTISASSGNESTPTTSTRPSFLPDVKNQKVVEQGLMEAQKQRGHYHNSNHSSTSSSSNGSYQNGYHKSSHHSHHSDMKRQTAYEDPTQPKKMRTDYHQSFVASSSSSSTTSISENGRYVQQQQQQTTTIMTTQQQPPSQQREESAYARQVRLLKAGAQQPVPLMSLPPPPLPPQQLQHLQQMQSQPPPQQSEYQKMCMALDKTRNQQYSAVNHHNSIIPTHPHHHLHHPMSSTQQISPPDESSPPLTSMILLPPPPPPPVLMPRRVDEIEDGELV
ncbi:CRE-CIT-1.2 protein [Caenorhabditis remanei]|uniref:CRE-CIT-1.2 protein n=1 Tax=Caenorhabditis remanei TaxID=31234 RepID=E3MP16_CAERE|nr:CRE-CIT-1.2 protein [Caenorhabditis remanei]